MLIPFSWLCEFIDTGMDAPETARALTMAGLEVEGMEAVGDDYVLEVNVTPNRPDALSVMGIARELRAITGRPLVMPQAELGTEAPADFRIEIEDSTLCARYAGRIVRGVKVAPSPEWIRQRLERTGIRSVNNVVDATNYVLMELGHPLHAFDLSTLMGGMIRVAVAGKGLSMVTIDESARELPEDALMIWDGKRPVAVAGVMGGKETEVGDETTDILIESAWFQPQSVRRTSRRMALSTDASYRFERGADVLMLKTALDRTAALVREVAGGTVHEAVDTYPAKFSPATVSINFKKVGRLLGMDLSPGEITGIVEKLDFNITGQSGEGLTLQVPSYRPDISMEADIIEEVARLYGYDRIPTALPRADISHSGTRQDPVEAAARETMRKEGFHEAINFSFMNTGSLDTLRIGPEDPRRDTVPIQNPLRAEDSVLRSTLVPSILDNFLYNFNRGMRDIRIFELSKVFRNTGGELPEEAHWLGGVLNVESERELWKDPSPAFYKAKGAVESLLHRLRIPGAEFKSPSTEPFLHPGKSADVMLDGRKAGFVCEVSPEVLEDMDLKSRPTPYLLELDMDMLSGSAARGVSYKPIPRYPAVERDLALVLEETVRASEVEDLIREFPSELVEDVRVFDVFRGGSVPAGKKSLAFSIRYRSLERTLTDDEVEPLHKSIVDHLAQKTGASLRG